MRQKASTAYAQQATSRSVKGVYTSNLSVATRNAAGIFEVAAKSQVIMESCLMPTSITVVKSCKKGCCGNQ
jgi:hypothetical protein